MRPVTPRSLHVLLVALAAAFGAGQPATAQVAPLDADVETILRQTRVSVCTIGVVILDPRSGAILAEVHNGDPDKHTFIPASNMKLFTSGATLATLGSDFAFETILAHLEPPADDPEVGDRLIVHGSGDPAFADPVLLDEMGITVEDLLQLWVDAALQTGVTEFSELVVDARVFDDELVHESWPADQLNRWYCAEVSGLNFHTNVVRIFASPNDPGEPPRTWFEPDNAPIDARMQARSIRKGRHTFWASRRRNTNDITLHGDVLWNGEPLRVAIHDPAQLFAEILESRLESAGLRIGRARVAAPDDTLDGGVALHVVRTPIATVLRRCNADSHNLYAEAMLKRIGHDITRQPGSWPRGTSALRMIVQSRLETLEPGSATFADGSGMSRRNRVTPLVTARWIGSIATDPEIGDAFVESLARPGVGTLRERFLDADFRNELWAKSGYLNGVTSLSGLLQDPETGRQVVFSILVNDRPATIPGTWIQAFYQDVIDVADGWLTERVQRQSSLGG